MGLNFFVCLVTSQAMIWSLLVSLTLLALVKFKVSGASPSSMLLYLVVQEGLGITFISELVEPGSSLVVTLKAGLAPFHFWMPHVLRGSLGHMYSWLLTMQKLPYVSLVMLTWNWSLFLLVVLGSVMPLLQALVVKGVWCVVFLLLSSSSNNLLVLGWYEPMAGLYMNPVYFGFMYYMLNSMSAHGSMSLTYELVFIMMGFPGSVSFYVKLAYLYVSFSLGGVLLLVVLLGFVLNLVVGLHLLLCVHTLPRVTNKLFLSLFFASLFVMLV